MPTLPAALVNDSPARSRGRAARGSLGKGGRQWGCRTAKPRSCCECVRENSVLACKKWGKGKGKRKSFSDSHCACLPRFEGLPPTAGAFAQGPARAPAQRFHQRSHPATAWHRRSALLKSHKLRTSQTAQFNIKEHRQSLFSMSARPGCSGHRQCLVPSPVPARRRSEEPQSPGDSPGVRKPR